MNDFCEYRAFFDEAMSFYKSAQIVQKSDFRINLEETESVVEEQIVEEQRILRHENKNNLITIKSKML